jgi:hypothetical protein
MLDSAARDNDYNRSSTRPAERRACVQDRENRRRYRLHRCFRRQTGIMTAKLITATAILASWRLASSTAAGARSRRAGRPPRYDVLTVAPDHCDRYGDYAHFNGIR